MLGRSSRKSRVRCSRRVKAEPTKPRGVGMSRRVDPEQELLKALREQEPTAAEALVTAYGDRAYRLAVISDWSSSVDDPTVQTELRTMLSSAISKLPTHYQTMTILYDIEQL